MDEKVIKLLNILDAKFEIPGMTNGMNVIRNKGQILAVVNNYWPMGDNYTMEDFDYALEKFDAPSIVNWLGVREYMLIEK